MDDIFSNLKTLANASTPICFSDDEEQEKKNEFNPLERFQQVVSSRNKKMTGKTGKGKQT